MTRSRAVYTRKGVEYFVDGKPVTKKKFRGKPKPLAAPAVPATTAWPMESYSHAAHPDDVPALLARNKRLGITGVSYDESGMCKIDGRAAKKALNIAEGWYDKNGSYSDA